MRNAPTPAAAGHCWQILALNVTSAFTTRCGRVGRRRVWGRPVSLRARKIDEVPEETARVARAGKEQYAHRAGVAGTISQGVRAFGLRRCRYHGLAKARLQHQLTATAMNFHRLNAWWTNAPRARTRVSHLAALRPTGRCAS
ncbi:transposase [Streptomyces collinus]|uniref:transposase n=1 Tax=Streptomyces collinus TaxID=42684 RepID=UPI0037A2B90E